MPSIPAESLVLVSGASGFIAAHLVELLIKKGYKVRGTVRSEEKGEYLKKLFESTGKYPFEYAIVGDIAEEGAFDEAVKDVVGIAHTASPFYTNAKTAKELIDPALKGTTGILKSALAHNNSNLKRVVVTSSVAAIMSPKPAGKTPTADGYYTFDEKDWNDYSIGVVEKEGDSAPGGDLYRASKTLAEKAAWDFVKENKTSWDLATINPPLVLGPIIHDVPSPDKLNTSVAAFYGFLTGEKKDDDLKVATGNWVDVRDVALGHFLALTEDVASGERFITSSGPFCGQDLVDIVHKLPGDHSKVPVGVPGSGPEIDKKANVHSGKKAQEVLGLKYTPLTETVKDMYNSLQAKFDI